MSGHCILVKRKRREKVGGRWRGTYGVGDEVGRGDTIRGDRSTEPRICARRGRPFLPFPVLRVLPKGKKHGIYRECAAQRSAGRRNETGDFISGSVAHKAHGRHTQQKNSRNQPGAHYHEPQNHRSVHQRKAKITTQQQIPCQPIQEEEEEKEKPRITERCHVLYSHSSSSLSSLSSLSSSEELSPVLRLSFGLLCAWLGAWLGFPEAAPTRS